VYIEGTESSIFSDVYMDNLLTVELDINVGSSISVANTVIANNLSIAEDVFLSGISLSVYIYIDKRNLMIRNETMS